MTNGQLVIGGHSVGGVAALIANGVWNDGEHPLDGVFTWEATGALKYGLAQEGSWQAFRLSDHTEYDPSYYIDCDEQQTPGSTEAKACQAVDYFDPVHFDQKSPVFLVSGAQDESFPAINLQNTVDLFEEQTNPPVIRRLLEADIDHAYFFSAGIWKIQNDEKETYGNWDPIFFFPQDHFGFNEQWDSIAAFFNKIINSENYPPGPDTTEISITDNDPWTYTVKACLSQSYSLQPIGWRFNITIDGWFHVLPACSSVGTLDEENGTYTLTSGDYTDYAYNSDCFSLSDDDTESYTYERKCSLGQGISVEDVFDGVITQGPSGMACRKFSVIFDGAPPPDNIAAWVNLRYAFDEGQVASSGEIVTTDDDDEDLKPCIRPKSDSSSTAQDPFSILVGKVVSMTYTSNDIAGLVVDGVTGMPIPGAVIELRDDVTGDEYNPPLMAQADDWGWAKIEDAPDETVLVKVSADGYPSVLYYDLPRGIGVVPSLYPYSLIDQAYEDVGAERDEEMATLMIGFQYWDGEYPENWESVGCGEAVMDPAAEVHYAEYDSEMGLSWPTLDRDVSEGGPYNGEGTSPNYEPDGWPVSGFMAFNADADTTDVTFTIGEEEFEATIPYVCADCLVFVSYVLMPSAYPTNPTPYWCDE